MSEIDVVVNGVRYVPESDCAPEGDCVEYTPPVNPVDPADPMLKSGYLTEHFRVAEFDCNHCGLFGKDIHFELVLVLEDVRAHFDGAAVTINSGVRCPTHNRNVGGAPNSTHLSAGSVAGYPCAADIVVKGVSSSAVYAYLDGTYPNMYGIGKYTAQGFTHIDTRPGGPARW